MALQAGAIRFNADSSQMEIYDGNQWTGILATSPEHETGGTRGFGAGGDPFTVQIQQEHYLQEGKHLVTRIS